MKPRMCLFTAGAMRRLVASARLSSLQFQARVSGG